MRLPKAPFLLTSIAAFALLLPAAASAEVNAQFSMGVGLQGVRWEEYTSDHSSLLLQEEGLRYSGHIAYDNYDRNDSGLLIGLDVNGHVGDLDYSGRTFNDVALDTTSSYLGLNTKLTLGHRRTGLWGGYSWDWLGGFGFDYWERQIQDSTDAMSNPVTGYVETYSTLYAHAAIGLYRRMTRWSRYLQVGLKFPIKINENIGEPFNMELEPGRNASGFVNLTFFRHGDDDQRDFAISLYFDTHRFSDSPAVLGDFDANGNTIRDDYFYQPKSDQYLFGLRASLYF